MLSLQQRLLLLAKPVVRAHRKGRLRMEAALGCEGLLFFNYPEDIGRILGNGIRDARLGLEGKQPRQGVILLLR